jgi:dihydrofolate synthase/folylpolyglutamate synthase
MQIIRNFQQAKDVLYKYIQSTSNITRYNLDNISKLMVYLDNPQDKFKVIHIAGTSGKTSTSYYVASLLRQAGYDVGLTVSPHIDEINERVQVNLLPLPEQEYCRELNIFLNIIKASNLNPSYFELLIAFAYWVFAKCGMEYAVVEVGLGGLMDGTNVINRNDKVCVITDIGLDHTKILGKTISEIAYQKAGIIQCNNIVFMYIQEEEVMAQVSNRCLDKKADLHVINSGYPNYSNFESLPLFQIRNLNLATQTVNYILSRDYNKTLSSNEISNASNIYIPGRMEIVPYNGGMLILDGSHNEQKISALVESMHQKFPSDSVGLLVSFGENKQTSVLACLKLLSKISSVIILTAFNLGQDEVRVSIRPDELAVYAREAGFATVIVESEPSRALELLSAENVDIRLVTGSFYLLNNIRPIVFDKIVR